MTTTPAPITPLPLEDYDAIEAAVMETQRGRWFLTEYARRNRNSDTDQVLTAIERIERTLRRDRAAPDIDRIRLDLADMAEAISRTKLEIAQMKIESEEGGRFAEASQELDAIVGQTETATNEILLAAEGIQEVAWTLREDGAAAELCDRLDTHATDVYTACSFQDLTGQRTRKVVTVLRYLESRINAMIDIWGLQSEEAPEREDAPFDPMDARPDAHLLNGPQLAGRGVDQGQVDDLMWAQSYEIAFEAAGSMPETLEEEPAAIATTGEPTADVFERDTEETADLDYAAADVFSSEDASRLVADHRRSDAEEPAQPTIVTVALGNTLATVAIAAEAAAEAQPALTLVAAADPIAEMSAERRLITFG